MSSFTPSTATPQTSSFTCNTCGIKFPTAELQRQHMKAEWHRYNLKRRVAALPTISSDSFAELLLARQKAADEALAAGEYEDEYGFVVHKRQSGSGVRQVTKKQLRKMMKENRGRSVQAGQIDRQLGNRSPSVHSVTSEFSEFSLGDSEHDGDKLTTVDSHLESSSEYNYSEHLYTDVESTEVSESEASHIDDSDSDDDDDDDESFEDLNEQMVITNCFYCGAKHDEREDNIKHMFQRHGLYIPERSYLVQPDGLLTFIGEVIHEDHECLVCGFEGKNLESVRQHMKSKGHCRLPYETKTEKAVVSEFYDFTIPESKRKSLKRVMFQEREEGDDYEMVDSPHEAQTDEDSEEEGEEEEEEEEGYEAGEDSAYTTVSIDPSGVELTLPTGSRIGHRTMTRYYRQNLPLARDFSDSQRTIALSDRRFAPGLTSVEVSKQEKLERRVENRARNEQYRREKGSKVNFQAHFRDEMLQ